MKLNSKAGVFRSKNEKMYLASSRLWLGLSFLLVKSTSALNSSVPSPVFKWNEQKLAQCLLYNSDSSGYTECQQVGKLQASRPSGDLRACTSKPEAWFSCSATNFGLSFGCTCKNAAGLDTCAAISVDSTTITAPACMNVIFAVEGNWVVNPTYFLHDTGNGNLLGPDQIRFSGMLRTTVTVNFGKLDLLHSEQNCRYIIELGIQHCDLTNLDLGSQLSRLSFAIYMGEPIPRRSMTIYGSFEQTYGALQNMSYKGNQYQNSVRLTKVYYNPITAPIRPYETMNITIEYASVCKVDNSIRWWELCNFSEIGNLSQLVHISPINDSPLVTARPYVPPASCTGPTPENACYEGQYSNSEDTSTMTSIGGVTLDDPDLYESCPFGNPECKTLDVTVRADVGAIALNTRSNLNIYNSERNVQGFLATLAWAQLAVQVIQYQVMLPTELDLLTGACIDAANKYCKAALQYNTQHGGNREFVFITASDQGYTGIDGTKAVDTLIINFTIVAVNDAPTISSTHSELELVEDQPVVLSTLGDFFVEDVDADEQIDSALSRANWTASVASQQNMNMLEVTMQVFFGFLELPDASNLRVSAFDEVLLLTIAGVYGHDVCRVKSILDDVASLTRYSNGHRMGTYSKVCYGSCENGNCCFNWVDNACEVNNQIVLYLGTNGTGIFNDVNVLEWKAALTAYVSAKDKTCGGLPFLPPPNAFSFGASCNSNADCSEAILPACTPGVDCACCANISTICTTKSDCSIYDQGSMCGCRAGGSGEARCGPFCVGADAKICNITAITGKVRNVKLWGGVPCTYYGADPLGETYPGLYRFFTEPSIRYCLSPSYVQSGSGLQSDLDLISGVRRTKMSIVGSRVDVNKGLKRLRYVTKPQYNRLYRPPVSEQLSATFNINADSVDTLQIDVNDLGNSGGTFYDPKSASLSISMRVMAVNNPPVSLGPTRIYAREDTPFYFRAVRSANGTLLSGLQVSDPDSADFGFSSGIFTVNMSCNNGRLFLNESFLRLAGVSNVRITFKQWQDSRYEFRGLHTLAQGLPDPIFGDGCQFQVQCTDDSHDRSSDSKYGFLAKPKYGIVYSPQTKGGPSIGCGVCPENSGNKFLSLQGVMNDINLALTLVTYLPDPNFNTKTGSNADTIVFNVSDGGDVGNDENSPDLTDSLQIEIIVNSVNDRPIIGRQISQKRKLTSYATSSLTTTTVTDVQLLPVNKSLDSFCGTLPPSGDEYSILCGPTARQYIDVDEDTTFIITPDVLWINDIDATEAQNVENPRRYCCQLAGESGCVCGKSCPCTPPPAVCTAGTEGQPPGSPGQLIVNLTAVNGLLSFYPPPGRSIFPRKDLSFLVQKDKICQDQLECMRNVSTLLLLTTLASLQTGLEQMFLSYRGKPAFFGKDVISIVVTDQGFTDDCYNDSLTTIGSINVRVVAVNNPPVIQSNFTVLHYAQALRCYVDFLSFPRILGREGLAPSCFNSTESNVPPQTETAGLLFSDVDMDTPQAPYGNMTLLFIIGSQSERQKSAGTFFLRDIIKGGDLWYEQFRNSNGLWTFSMQGKMELLNEMMKNLRYDADPVFAGYLPIFVIANDMGNFGECNGDHVCGSQKVTCPDHLLAGPHKPADQGITTLQIDVTIDPPQSCVVISSSIRSDCDTCNLMSGCGWCPGYCGSQGKCMINGKGNPLFETCEIGADGSGWLMCSPGTPDTRALLLAVIVPAVSVVLLVFIFGRWVMKKYGTFVEFFQAKQSSIYRTGRKFHLLPSPDANWLQVAFLMILVGIITFILFLQQTGIPRCDFNHQYYLDHVSSISLKLDNCMVRFVPTRNKGYPDTLLPEPKMKFAFTNDAQITLHSEICKKDNRFELQNLRDESIKYSGYFCNVEIMVPDRIVMPDVTIVASGDNITTVRAGPMDADSPQFGLDFGPNTFSLLGNYMNVRLANISAKYISFDVVRGKLIATDIVVTTLGSFQSVDADMIVTTTQQARVTFLQKELNLVCLTAAVGSLYVDDACVYTCAYPNGSSPVRRRQMDRGANESKLLLREGSNQTFHNRRVNPWLCLGNLTNTAVSNCTQFDPISAQVNDTCPIGAPYKLKSAVPKVDGCFNLDDCTVDTSPKCLCKPHCDMAGLTPKGRCDELGQCCQDICGGYSRADLFPIENQPRCGALINPVTMPWCNGSGMSQQYRFTSTSGQISVQVLNAGWNSSVSVSSFKSSSPAETIPVDIGFLKHDANTTVDLFHPDGANFPQDDVFLFELSGPGTVEPSQGRFLWIRNVEYLLFQPFFLHFFSLGVLEVRTGFSALGLAPGFCPAYVDVASAEYNARLVKMHSLLMKTLQSDPPTTPLPGGSMLVFENLGELPRIFSVDPRTNEPTVTFFSDKSYNLSLIVVYLAIAIPGLFSFLIVVLCSRSYILAVSKYRKLKMEENKLSKNISVLLQPRIPDEADLDDFARSERALVARTNFFYMFEEGFSDAEEQRTVLAMFGFVIAETSIVLCPAGVVYYAAGLLRDLYSLQSCRFRPDFCSCRQEAATITTASSVVIISVYIYFFTAVAEMCSHYLFLKLSIRTRILRGGFLFLLFSMIGLCLFYIMTIILFVLLGVLVRPQASIPYAIAVIGLLACTLSFFFKLNRYQGGIEQKVRKKMKKEVQKMLLPARLPRALLAILVEKNIKKVLRAHGLSVGKRVLWALALAGSLAVVCIFLILGFRAFTDLNNTTSSIVNSGLILLVAFLGFQSFQNEDEAAAKEKEEQIVRYLKKVFGMLLTQIEIADTMFGMQPNLEPLSGEDE